VRPAEPLAKPLRSQTTFLLRPDPPEPHIQGPKNLRPDPEGSAKCRCLTLAPVRLVMTGARNNYLRQGNHDQPRDCFRLAFDIKRGCIHSRATAITLGVLGSPPLYPPSLKQPQESSFRQRGDGWLDSRNC